jgi:chromosome segregation ATPase
VTEPTPLLGSCRRCTTASSIDAMEPASPPSGRRQQVSECHIISGNSRACEVGTHGCVVCHEAIVDEADLLRSELDRVKEQLARVIASGDCHGPLTEARYRAEAELAKAREDRDLMAARIRELREQLHPALTALDSLRSQLAAAVAERDEAIARATVVTALLQRMHMERDESKRQHAADCVLWRECMVDLATVRDERDEQVAAYDRACAALLETINQRNTAISDRDSWKLKAEAGEVELIRVETELEEANQYAELYAESDTAERIAAWIAERGRERTARVPECSESYSDIAKIIRSGAWRDGPPDRAERERSEG